MTIFQGVILNGTEVINAPTIVGDTAFQTNNQTITFGQPLAAASTRLSQDTTRAQLLLGLGTALGNQFIIGSNAWIGHDYDHAAFANPTFLIHSATDPDVSNTQWISIAHDQTNGVIVTGLGDLTLSPQSTITNCSIFYANQFWVKNSLTGALAGSIASIDAIHIAPNNNDVAIVPYVYRFRNFDHIAQVNPTVYIQSVTDPDVNNTQWMSFTHEVTQGKIATGVGPLVLEPFLSGTNYVQINGGANIYGHTQILQSGSIFAHSNGAAYGYLFYPYGNAQVTLAIGGNAAGTTMNNFVLTNAAWYSRNFDHAASTNPTLFIHSNVDPDVNNTQWLGLNHDQTNAVITAGKGKLVLNGAGGANGFVSVGDSPSYQGLATSNSLIVGNALEVAQDVFAKYYGCVNVSEVVDSGHITVQDDGLHVWVKGTNNTANNNYVLTTWPNSQQSHGLGTPSANPTFWVFSAEDVGSDTTQWLKFYHDQTNPHIEGGLGILSIDSGSGARIGTAASFAGIAAPGSLIINVDGECGGVFYVKDIVYCTSVSGSQGGGHVTVPDDGVQIWVLSPNGTANNNYILTNDQNKGLVHGHGAPSSDPTFFIHSDTSVGTSTAQWISFKHNQTDGVITTGTGDIQLVPSSGITVVTGSIATEANDMILTPSTGDTQVTGVGLKTREYDTSMNDEASFDLPTSTAGMAMFTIGHLSAAQDFALFIWSIGGVPTSVFASANIRYTDSDNFFCFFDGGSAITVKNRMGVAKEVRAVIWYSA